MTTQPIFKTLAPDEIYILHIIDGRVKYIANIDGEAFLKESPLEKPDE